jgi:hypothetical protein
MFCNIALKERTKWYNLPALRTSIFKCEFHQLGTYSPSAQLSWNFGVGKRNNVLRKLNPDYALEIVMKLSNAIKTRVSG